MEGTGSILVERPVAVRAILMAFSPASGTGRREDGLLREVARNELVQALGEAHIVFVRHDLVAGVGETVDLRLHGFDHLGVAVPGVDHGDAGSKIDVLSALDIPDFSILRTLGINLRGHTHAARNGFVLACGNFGIQHREIPWIGVAGQRPASSCPMKQSKIYLHFFCRFAIRIYGEDHVDPTQFFRSKADGRIC